MTRPLFDRFFGIPVLALATVVKKICGLIEPSNVSYLV